MRRDRRGRDSGRSGLMGEINVTPLMDLTFLLLVVFIITAPMLQYGVDVSPPRMNADKIDQSRSITVTLTAHGLIMFQQETMELPSLRDRLRFWRDSHPEAAVLIAADANRPYKEVIEVMKAVRAAGVVSVALLTQAEQKESRPRRR